MKHGKKYVDSAKLIDHLNAYDPAEACELACKTSKAKFDETIEISVRLGVDPRHADQQVRGAVVLPHGTGRTVRVLVVTKGDKVKEAEAAGADIVGGEEMIHKIQTENWFAQRRAPSEFIVMLTAGLLYWSNSSFASVTTSPSNGALPLRSVDLMAYSSNVCPFLSNSEGETPHFRRRSFGSSDWISGMLRYLLISAVSL